MPETSTAMIPFVKLMMVSRLTTVVRLRGWLNTTFPVPDLETVRLTEPSSVSFNVLRSGVVVKVSAIGKDVVVRVHARCRRLLLLSRT